MQNIFSKILSLFGPKQSKPSMNTRVMPDYYCSGLSDGLKLKLSSLPHSTLYKSDIMRPAKVVYGDMNIDCVLFVLEKEYLIWHPFAKTKLFTGPEDLRGFSYNTPYRLMINANKIGDILPCPYQLPPKWCNKIYKYGEGYMGGFLFTLIFKDGSTAAYATAGVVDFIELPSGYSFDDIVDVKPRIKDLRQMDYSSFRRGLPFVWCVYK